MKLCRPASARTFPAAAPQTLPPKTLGKTADGVLRQRIIDGELQAKESLHQAAIARQYAVRRTPLREATPRSEVEWLPLFRPGKGAVVSGLSLSEMQEVIDLPAMMEPEVWWRAIPHLAMAAPKQAKRIPDGHKTVLPWLPDTMAPASPTQAGNEEACAASPPRAPRGPAVKYQIRSVSSPSLVTTRNGKAPGRRVSLYLCEIRIREIKIKE